MDKCVWINIENIYAFHDRGMVDMEKWNWLPIIGAQVTLFFGFFDLGNFSVSFPYFGVGNFSEEKVVHEGAVKKMLCTNRATISW